MSPAVLLMVDDDASNRDRLQEAWPTLDAGLRLVTAASTDEALDIATKRYCDVVATDHRPGLPGIKILDAVHRMCPGTRLILTPARLTTRLLVEASELPPYRVLAKPFTPRQLAEAASLEA